MGRFLGSTDRPTGPRCEVYPGAVRLILDRTPPYPPATTVELFKTTPAMPAGVPGGVTPTIPNLLTMTHWVMSYNLAVNGDGDSDAIEILLVVSGLAALPVWRYIPIYPANPATRVWQSGEGIMIPCSSIILRVHVGFSNFGEDIYGEIILRSY